jgi:hypothetical protein
MARELIMVMGVQRSGTTALFRSLASDKSLTSFDENIDNAIYYAYRLRPLPEIAQLLEAAPRAVLLKPLSETFYRGLDELLAEYAEYDLRVVWLYRDPVNVLYSMHRQGWLPLSEIVDPMYVSQWERRNQLALRFQQQHRGKIAILRYEDCFTDPQVFRELTEWLQVRSSLLFRKNSGKGRAKVSVAAQQKIDAMTERTLLTLDNARTFKPRPLYRWKGSFLKAFSDLRKKRGAASGGPSVQSGSSIPNSAFLSTPPPVPSELAGLRFWLDASVSKPGPDNRSNNLRERGPRRMLANGDAHPPFHIPILNGRPALFFPAGKVGLRRAAASGVLRFGVGEDWSFMFDGGPVSIFALFKPDLPTYPPYQQRAVVFRVGPQREVAPAFILEWDGQSSASKGVIVAAERADEIIAATPPGDHPCQQWRIAHLRYAASEKLFSIPNNDPRRARITPGPGRQNGDVPGADCELQLGGNERERDSLFCGAIAEVIIFKRALEPNEQLGIMRYLKEKYQL